MHPDVVPAVPRALTDHYLGLLLRPLPLGLALPQWRATVTALVPPQTLPPCVLAPKPWRRDEGA